MYLSVENPQSLLDKEEYERVIETNYKGLYLLAIRHRKVNKFKSFIHKLNHNRNIYSKDLININGGEILFHQIYSVACFNFLFNYIKKIYKLGCMKVSIMFDSKFWIFDILEPNFINNDSVFDHCPTFNTIEVEFLIFEQILNLLNIYFELDIQQEKHIYTLRAEFSPLELNKPVLSSINLYYQTEYLNQEQFDSNLVQYVYYTLCTKDDKKYLIHYTLLIINRVKMITDRKSRYYTLSQGTKNEIYLDYDSNIVLYLIKFLYFIDNEVKYTLSDYIQLLKLADYLDCEFLFNQILYECFNLSHECRRACFEFYESQKNNDYYQNIISTLVNYREHEH